MVKDKEKYHFEHINSISGIKNLIHLRHQTTRSQTIVLQGASGGFFTAGGNTIFLFAATDVKWFILCQLSILGTPIPQTGSNRGNSSIAFRYNLQSLPGYEAINLMALLHTVVQNSKLSFDCSRWGLDSCRGGHIFYTYTVLYFFKNSPTNHSTKEWENKDPILYSFLNANPNTDILLYKEDALSKPLTGQITIITMLEDNHMEHGVRWICPRCKEHTKCIQYDIIYFILHID